MHFDIETRRKYYCNSISIHFYLKKVLILSIHDNLVIIYVKNLSLVTQEL